MKIDVYSANVTAPNGSFVSNSDISLKSNVSNVSTDECLRLIERIDPKTYTRNDLNDEKRVGFISNDFEAELSDDMRNIVGSYRSDEGGHLTTTLDYGRLTTVLWAVVKNLNERVKNHEARIEAIEAML